MMRTRVTTFLEKALLGAGLILTATLAFGGASTQAGSTPSSAPTDPGSSQNTNGPVAGRDFKAGEILVTFEEKASATARSDAVRAKGDRMGPELEGRPNTAAVTVGANRTVAEAVRAYEADPNVRHAQPNYLYRAQKTPDDPSYDQLWGLNNKGQEVNGTYGTADRDIDMEAAWDTRTDCSNIPVAVIDTGINYEHADLAGNMWEGAPNHGKDFYAEDGDPLPDGGQYHGTHVAGTIAAVGDNGTGTTGVCWNAEIMALRALGPDATGGTDDIAEAIDYARNQGAQVINLSLAGPNEDAILKDTLEKARDTGILVVAAAGNSGTNVDNNNARYPCSYELDNIICIAALDQDYGLPGWSNWGVDSVDVGAPGANILAPFPGNIITSDFNDWDTTSTDSGDWTRDSTCDSDYSLLVNPATWCTDDPYTNDAKHTTFRTFDLSDSQLGAAYRYSVDYSLADDGDVLKEGYWAGSGDPFSNGGTAPWSPTGQYDSGTFVRRSSIPEPCTGESACSIGFQLETDGSGTAEGVAVRDFRVQKVTREAKATAFLYGTSMATPHVAGIAALAWAEVPEAEYGEVRRAILEGGDAVDALDNKTVTGKAVDAPGTIQALEGAVASNSGGGGGCVRGGGCTMNETSQPFDPLWPAMLALAWLLRRRQGLTPFRS